MDDPSDRLLCRCKESHVSRCHDQKYISQIREPQQHLEQSALRIKHVYGVYVLGEFFSIEISILLSHEFQVGLLVILFLCDTIQKEFEKILTLTYKLDTLGILNQDCDIREFRDAIQDYRPSFTAARFFCINRKTIFSVLNSLTTFFIVMIQFK
jgi:hypothetical protein